MENTTNEILVKVSSRFAVPNDLELGQEVEMEIKGQVVKKEIRDNQDGTVDIIYVVKPIIGTVK